MGQRIGLLVAVLSFVWGANAKAQSESVPYIYYYSDRLHTFIVERADGTDSRILGDGLMPDYGDDSELAMGGPGWSPSGRWFAWTAKIVGDYNDSPPKPFAIRSDGTRRLTILDDLPNAVMAWAPQNDLLLVASQYAQPGLKSLDVPTFIALIDPSRNVPIAAFHTVFHGPSWPDCGQDESVTWTQDGYGIAQYAVGPNGVDPETAQISFFVVDTKGLAYIQTRQSLLGPITSPGGCDAAVSARGDIAYQCGTALVIENLITHQQRIIRNAFEADTDFTKVMLQWSPDGQYALLFTRLDKEIQSIEQNSVRLLSLPTNHLTALPGSVRDPDLPNLEVPKPLWSPDGRHALFGTVDADLYHVAVDPPQMVKFGDAGAYGNWTWTGNAQAAIDEDGSVYHYDFNTGMRSLLTAIKADFWPESKTPYHAVFHQFALSPDGRSVAYVEAGAVIHDIQSDVYRYIRPLPTSLDGGGSGEVAWSKDSHWLLVYEYAGGSQEGPRNLGVARADGAMLRALTSSSESPEPNMLNWLPDQVKPEYLPPPISRPLYPQPQAVLQGNDWPYSLAWSPDGQEILAISTDGVPTLWNVAAGSSSTIALPPSTAIPFQFAHLKGWSKDADKMYKPIIDQETLSSKEGKWKGLRTLVTGHGAQQVLASDDDFASIRVMDARTGQELHHLSLPHSMNSVEGADFSPNGRFLALSGRYMPVQVWDTQTWQLVASLPDPSVDVAFSLDGKWLATGSSWDIDLWDVATLAEPSQAISGGN